MKPRMKILVLAASCLCASALIVVVLVAASGILRDSHGSFLRILPPHPVEELDSLNIKSNAYYFVGQGDSCVFLARRTSIYHLLKVNLYSLDTQHINVSYQDLHNVKFWSPRLIVDPPSFYLVDGTIPLIYKGELSDRIAYDMGNDSIFFRDMIVSTKDAFIVKALSGKTGENILGRISSRKPHWLLQDSVLVKQKDGVFCTDGTLTYNREKGRFVYCYYYRNQFVAMDSSLSVTLIANTIDTTSVARIVPATISSDGTRTLASPHYLVNRSVRSSGKWILVHSELMAKNETIDSQTQASVIDLYDIETGKYSFSFYVYNFLGTHRMSEFYVSGDRMMVRYGNLLRAFRLKPEYFVDGVEI